MKVVIGEIAEKTFFLLKISRKYDKIYIYRFEILFQTDSFCNFGLCSNFAIPPITGVILIYNLRADIFAVIPLPIDASTLLVVHMYAVAAFPCDRHSLSAYVIYTPIIDRYENSIRCCLC